jgi:hypothetical protein
MGSLLYVYIILELSVKKIEIQAALFKLFIVETRIVDSEIVGLCYAV